MKPPQAFSFNNPKIMAIEHKTIPAIPIPLLPLVTEIETIPTTKPPMANGIFSQFNHPKNGTKAINIPNTDNKPSIKLITCI